MFAARALAGGLPTEEEVFARALARMDKDGDGKVSAAEYAPFDNTDTFGDIDKNGDGAFDAAELGAWTLYTQPRPNNPSPVATAAYADGDPSGANTTAVAPGAGNPTAGGLPPEAPGAGGGHPTRTEPGRTDMPDDPTRIQLHLVDLRHLAAGAPLEVTINGGEVFTVTDEGKGVDRVAGDGVYAFLTARPPSPEIRLQVTTGAGTWSGQVSVSRARTARPVPIELGTDGTFVVAAIGDKGGGEKGGGNKGGGEHDGNGFARVEEAAPKPIEAAPPAATNALHDWIPVFAALAGGLGIGLGLGMWRRKAP